MIELRWKLITKKLDHETTVTTKVLQYRSNSNVRMNSELGHYEIIWSEWIDVPEVREE
jgi:hypothetical protein